MEWSEWNVRSGPVVGSAGAWTAELVGVVRRATEVVVATLALNRMLELGRPNYVRIA